MEKKLQDLKHRMDGAVKNLQEEFAGLRAGRASTAMLEPIRVESYGQTMPLTQLASLSAPEARLLVVQVWDKSQTEAIEKAIRNSDLGLNPQTEGQVIRVPIPPLDEERRRELVKTAARYAEQARVAVRNVRRSGIDEVRAEEKAKDIGQDEARSAISKIDAATSESVGAVDKMLAAKEKDIVQI